MIVSAIRSIPFTSRDDNDGGNNNKIRATEVGVVGGATVGGAKFGISSLKKFNNKAFMMSEKTVKAVKEGAQVSTKVKSLWAKMFANAKTYKDAIVKWAKSTATGKLTQKIVQSKAFGKISAVLGGAGALFVFISGIGEMGNTLSKISNKQD